CAGHDPVAHATAPRAACPASRRRRSAGSAAAGCLMKDRMGWSRPHRRIVAGRGIRSRSQTHVLPRTTRMLTTLLAGVLALAACESGDPASPAEVAEVRILSGSQAVTVRVDGTVRLEARGFDAGGRAITGLAIDWQSLDPDVAEVDGTGRVKGLAVGEA